MEHFGTRKGSSKLIPIHMCRDALWKCGRNIVHSHVHPPTGKVGVGALREPDAGDRCHLVIHRVVCRYQTSTTGCGSTPWVTEGRFHKSNMYGCPPQKSTKGRLSGDCTGPVAGARISNNAGTKEVTSTVLVRLPDLTSCLSSLTPSEPFSLLREASTANFFVVCRGTDTFQNTNSREIC